MNSKTIVTAMVAMIVAIGMTGLVAAVTTDVTYTGDGSYDMNFNGVGDGYCGVHTYTSNGEDHMQATWQNAEANGWQTMGTYDYDYTTTTSTWWGYVTGEDSVSGTSTDIDRVITVGGMDDGANASGSILTFTNDTNGNTLLTLATYRDDVAWTSHVTTDQFVSIYQDQWNGYENSVWGFYHDEYNGSETGVYGETDISGFAYGADTLVTGLMRTQTGDAYAYALVEMTEGEFELNAYTDAYIGEYSNSGYFLWGLFPFSYSDEYAGVDEGFDVDANGVGLFVLGAGVDEFYGWADLYDDNGYLNIYFDGMDVTAQIITQVDGNLDGEGYIYSVDLP